MVQPPILLYRMVGASITHRVKQAIQGGLGTKRNIPYLNPRCHKIPPPQEINCYRECKRGKIQNNFDLKKVDRATTRRPENSPRVKGVTPISERIIKETVRRHKDLMLSLADK